MRGMQEEKADDFGTQFSPPPLLAARNSSKCYTRSCPWWPYSSSNDFRRTATVIIIILLCSMLATLVLNAVIRYLFTHRRRRRQPDQESPPPRKPEPCSASTQMVEPPTVAYSSELKLAGQEAECTICLSEFVDGDKIRVLGKCNHGFHVHCIEVWLGSHSNCPTCRACCLSSGDNKS